MSEQNANVEQALKHVSTSKSFEYRSKSGIKAHSKILRTQMLKI